MQLDTRHFGLIDIDEKGIIEFPEGLPGFEDVKKYVLLGSTDEDMIFRWLQSVDSPELAFVVIDPRLLVSNYEVDVDDSEVEILSIKDTEKVALYSIVVVPDDIAKMTANLKAPLIINTENMKGKQVILDKSDYQIKHFIMEELQKIGGKK